MHACGHDGEPCARAPSVEPGPHLRPQPPTSPLTCFASMAQIRRQLRGGAAEGALLAWAACAPNAPHNLHPELTAAAPPPPPPKKKTRPHVHAPGRRQTAQGARGPAAGHSAAGLPASRGGRRR
jgi:hypothetical protein